ncbi:HAD family hydrolase [Candidatus Nucleicultrix amoebiphila]|jgi:phosphoglycolate phosphatase-like HAD superfamily hydrolase|uniref:HAD family hydrolase n=1 Tax=Candidatus Nucleicultrix amoebiphila TaxID=1509244 RepID=UPI000A26FF87|nr:HAD family phosphatase [Candidatus Nucleicultrix amoebiphila]
MLKAVFFDFDGVILDSASIKTEAFYELYLSYGIEIANKARDYHLQNQGVSRYKKFEYIHTLILKREYSESEGQILSRIFSDIIMDKMLNCKFIDGVVEFLSSLKKNNVMSFVLSATPHEELLNICKRRNLLGYFSGIFGAPDTKTVIGEKIVKNYSLRRDQILFIGDSLSDLEAANALKIPFLARTDNLCTGPFPLAIRAIKNFHDFKLI